MRSRVINNGILLFLAVVLLTYLGLHVRVATAANAVAVLKTVGMTCGSCSSTINSALESVRGVAVIEVDIEGGWVVVGYDSALVEPETLAGEINSAGFASGIYRILTPEQFKQITGRDIGKQAGRNSGCCGGKGGGCSSGKQGKQS